jgi:phospholipid/cholesterol/gamma-HCH transport system substrate-binding protein
MKSIRWTAVKLGIFTGVTVVITALLAAVIGNFQFFSHPYEIKAEFTDATGLLSGDVVKAAGVAVGRVSDIEIDDGIALVTLSINDGVELPAGLAAQIRYRNLVGQRQVNLVAPVATDEVTERGTRIPLARTEPALDLSVLFNGLRPLIRSTSPHDINVVSHALLTAFRGRSSEVESVIGNLDVLSRTVSSRDTELSSLLRDLNVVTSDLSARGGELGRTLANLNRLLAEIDSSKTDLSAALVNLNDAAVVLRRVVRKNDSNIKAEVGDIATLVDAVDDKRAALRGAIRELPAMLAAVQRVTTYGQWTNLHLINVCKDDTGKCGRRAAP